MKRKSVICAALGLALLLGGCSAGPAAPELLEPVSVASDMAVAEVSDMYDGMVLEGSILPETEELSFDVSGRIGEICVVLGQEVKKGDPLIRLDTPALEEERDDLAERLEEAKKMDEFDSREEELNIQQLAQSSGVYSSAYQLTLSRQEKAARQRAAQIEKLEEQLEEADEKLNVQSVITAPFRGTVAGIFFNVGDHVQPETVAVVLADNTACCLQTEFISEATVSSAKALYAMVGGVRYDLKYRPMDVDEYITKALSGQTLRAKYDLIGAKSDLIGQYALLYLMTDQREQVLNIPANALLRKGSEFYVYTDDNGKRVRRSVEVGLMTSAQVEILSGLEKGERVYVVE